MTDEPRDIDSSRELIRRMTIRPRWGFNDECVVLGDILGDLPDTSLGDLLRGGLSPVAVTALLLVGLSVASIP